MPSKSANIFSCSYVLVDADVVGRSGSSFDIGDSSSMLGLAMRSTIGFVSVDVSSFISAIDADRENVGEVGDVEECMLTKESRGLPSSSGSGRDPNLEPLEVDRPRPPPVVKEPFGDNM